MLKGRERDRVTGGRVEGGRVHALPVTVTSTSVGRRPFPPNDDLPVESRRGEKTAGEHRVRPIEGPRRARVAKESGEELRLGLGRRGGRGRGNGGGGRGRE